MDHLKDRFDPSTSVTDANELYQLFQLCYPVWELNILLDNASNFWRRITEKKMNVPDSIFYSAVMGMIPPAYQHVCTTYKSTV